MFYRSIVICYHAVFHYLQVNFDQFKEGFVEVLAKELENSKAEEDEDDDQGSRGTPGLGNNRDAVQTPETVETFDLTQELEDEPEAIRGERSESRLSRASYTSLDTGIYRGTKTHLGKET